MYFLQLIKLYNRNVLYNHFFRTLYKILMNNDTIKQKYFIVIASLIIYKYEN